MTGSHDAWLQRKLRATRRVRASGKFAKYADDPVGFAVDVLGLTMWERAEEIAVSVRDNDRTLVVGGHKVSKSTMDTALSLWWGAAAHPGRDTRAIWTAPAAHQVKNILWDELEKRLEWLEENRPRVRDDLGPELPKDPLTGWRMSSGAQIIGITSDQPERLAGLSGAHVLIVIEEASGYRDDLFNAIQGNEAGGAKLLASSNPTKPQGWYFDGTTNGEWHVIQISCLESPNYIAQERLIPGLATFGWVERMQRLHAPNPEEHPEYQIRVLGQFPERAENQVISMARLKVAQAQWVPSDRDAYGRLAIGVDPARYGVDECVIQAARGDYAYRPIILGGSTDGFEIAEAVVDEAMRRRRLPTDRTVTVRVDGVSSGAAAVDALRYHPACQSGAISVIVHEGFRPARDEARFANARTEAWFALDTWLKTGKVPPNRDLQREALAALYHFDHKARMVMEAKDRMKKKLKRSPNRADALALAVMPVFDPSGDGYQSGMPGDEDLGAGW